MKPITNIVSIWFGALMVVVVLFLGGLIAFTDVMTDRLYGNKRTFFIVLMFSYAVYRSYRIYQIRKSKQEDNA